MLFCWILGKCCIKGYFADFGRFAMDVIGYGLILKTIFLIFHSHVVNVIITDAGGNNSFAMLAGDGSFQASVLYR